MTIGERIKERRKELELTQTELGNRLNITKSSISYIELDRENMTTIRVERIAKALNVNPAWLCGWSEMKEGE